MHVFRLLIAATKRRIYYYDITNTNYDIINTTETNNKKKQIQKHKKDQQ